MVFGDRILVEKGWRSIHFLFHNSFKLMEKHLTLLSLLNSASKNAKRC